MFWCNESVGSSAFYRIADAPRKIYGSLDNSAQHAYFGVMESIVVAFRYIIEMSIFTIKISCIIECWVKILFQMRRSLWVLTLSCRISRSGPVSRKNGILFFNCKFGERKVRFWICVGFSRVAFGLCEVNDLGF